MALEFWFHICVLLDEFDRFSKFFIMCFSEFCDFEFRLIMEYGLIRVMVFDVFVVLKCCRDGVF